MSCLRTRAHTRAHDNPQVLLLGAVFRCVGPALTIAASLSTRWVAQVRSIRGTRPTRRGATLEVRPMGGSSSVRHLPHRQPDNSTRLLLPPPTAGNTMSPHPTRRVRRLAERALTRGARRMGLPARTSSPRTRSRWSSRCATSFTRCSQTLVSSRAPRTCGLSETNGTAAAAVGGLAERQGRAWRRSRRT